MEEFYDKLLECEDVDCHPLRRGGLLCVAGTRVTVAEVLEQLAGGQSAVEVEYDLGLDDGVVGRILGAVANCLLGAP